MFKEKMGEAARLGVFCRGADCGITDRFSSCREAGPPLRSAYRARIFSILLSNCSADKPQPLSHVQQSQSQKKRLTRVRNPLPHSAMRSRISDRGSIKLHSGNARSTVLYDVLQLFLNHTIQTESDVA